MKITIFPKLLHGNLSAIPSKSQAHRALICAAFSEAETLIFCSGSNQDIDATVGCLNAIGAHISPTSYGFHVMPAKNFPSEATLDCGESGTTFRFMLPIIGALGINGTFLLSGRLPSRPISPLADEMEQMGCKITTSKPNIIHCTGQLKAGVFRVRGNISSQFISGLLFAGALMKGTTCIHVLGNMESSHYVQLTIDTLSQFGASSNLLSVRGSYPFRSPGRFRIEGDWSNSSFFLAANSLGSNISISGLNTASLQGDRVCQDLIAGLKNYSEIDCKDIPDLVPILSVVAAANKGATFHNIQRLRLKESDRVESTLNMIQALGGQAYAEDASIRVFPAQFHGCTIDSVNDHRIAMSAAIAASVTSGPVSILNAQCVSKSYPTFWTEYKKLGGDYE